MTLRNAARQVLTEAREGIAWIVLYKEGRGWNAEPFWPDYDEKAGTLTFDPDDLPRIHEILEADPSAVIVNGYETNLGDTESMTRDTLASFLRWQYDEQYSRLSDRIQPTARPMYKTIPEALEIFDSLDPASIHTITEDVRGETMTGTPAELLERIMEQDRERNGAINHSAETVEGWAIIETAYSIAGNETMTNPDGTHKWIGLYGRV